MFNRLFVPRPALAALASIVMTSTPASAAIFGNVISKVNELGSELTTLGSAAAVPAFVWACLAALGKMAGFAAAVVVLLIALCIANARTIVTFFTAA